MKKTVAVVSRVLSIALLLSFVNNVSADEATMVKAPRSHEEMMKAPRDDAQTGAVIGCCTCSGEDNLECEILKEAKLIETKIDQLQSSFDECCEELNSKLDELQITVDIDFAGTFTAIAELQATVDVDFAGTWTAIEEVQTTLESCCEGLNDKLDTDFAGTWTAIEELQSTQDACCDELNSKLDVLQTTIDTDFAGTWTAVEEVQTTLDTCCADLHGDFVETWTVLGSPMETIAQSTLDTVLDVNATTTMNIIEWLKLIYNKVK
ncbi:hypothetical protein KJZ61_01050 [Candidatus Dependentiae bacterium]|nr:hypothetical protein [Candidatus Dependentiae bacterium]